MYVSDVVARPWSQTPTELNQMISLYGDHDQDRLIMTQGDNQPHHREDMDQKPAAASLTLAVQYYSRTVRENTHPEPRVGTLSLSLNFFWTSHRLSINLTYHLPTAKSENEEHS